MSIRIFILVLIYTIIFASCTGRKAKLVSLDRNFWLEIVDKGDIRILTQGSELYDQINTAELDISRVDLEVEGIFVCWKNENGLTEIVIPYSKVLKTDFDKSRFKFSTNLDTIKTGVLNVAKFHERGCFEYSIFSNELFPVGNGIIE